MIKHMYEQIKNYSEKDGVTYTFEQTPAESAAHRLAMISFAPKVRFSADIRSKFNSL